jgi:regulator of cell morphogenesis and NO signaling
MQTVAQTPFATRTVGDIAGQLPGATAVFRKYKLDFCCGGEVPLAEAAAGRGVDVSVIEQELAALGAGAAAPADSPTLIDHILTRYHETHRRELVELIKLARKVEAVHADHPRAPRGLADLLAQVQGELEVHMKKEELILFPAMKAGAFGRLDAPIGQMRLDHDDHGARLRQIEAMTNDFSPPEGACRSWCALYAGAKKFADDVMEHVALENNVLFPRFSG